MCVFVCCRLRCIHRFITCRQPLASPFCLASRAPFTCCGAAVSAEEVVEAATRVVVTHAADNSDYNGQTPYWRPQLRARESGVVLCRVCARVCCQANNQTHTHTHTEVHTEVHTEAHTHRSTHRPLAIWLRCCSRADDAIERSPRPHLHRSHGARPQWCVCVCCVCCVCVVCVLCVLCVCVCWSACTSLVYLFSSSLSTRAVMQCASVEELCMCLNLLGVHLRFCDSLPQDAVTFVVMERGFWGELERRKVCVCVQDGMRLRQR